MFYDVMYGFGVVGVLVVVVFVSMIWRSISRQNMGFKLASVTNSRLVAHKCGYCSGGVQVLNDGVWGPFTEQQKMLGDCSPYLESRSVNSRNCASCAGKGFLWEDVPNESGYRPPNMGYIEEMRRRVPRWR